MKNVSNVSRFSSFVGKTVKSGSKVIGSTTPQLTLQSTKDKFLFNQKAASLMGIDAGSYIVLIDSNRGSVETEGNGDRYFVTKGYKKPNGSMEGAKLGKALDFSYSGIWSAILMDVPSITEAKPEDLFAAGKVTKSVKSENWISKEKVTMDVQPFEIEDADGNVVTEFEVAPGITQPIFILTNLKFEVHVTEVETAEPLA